MDAAAASASRLRGKPSRGRPLVPPNYVSLRRLQEQRRREEEEEAAATRAREEQRKRQEEEEAAARRFVEERRRREEEAAARRARDAATAAARRPEMRASSSSHASSSSSSSSSSRYNERARGGQRLVVVPDRPPPPPRRVCAVEKIDGGCRGNNGPDGGAASESLWGGFRAQNADKGKVSAGVLAGPGEPDKPPTAPSHAGKPEEKRNGEASGCQSTALVTSSASGEMPKLDIASYRGPARRKHRNHSNKKGLDGRSTETAMTSSTGEVVEASPLPAVNLDNKGKSRSGDQSTEAAMSSMPGKVAEALPPRGVKSDNRGEKKSLGGRQAGATPSSDVLDVKKLETSGCEGISSVVSSTPGEQADADGASYQMLHRPMYRRKGGNGLDGRSTERVTAIVTSKPADSSTPEGISLEIKGIKGLAEQGTETALARMPGEAADTSLARGFKAENKGKDSSGGKRTGMAPSTNWSYGMKPQPCPAGEGSDSQRSSVSQGTSRGSKTEVVQGKHALVEVKVLAHPATESISYLRNSCDQGMIQVKKSEDSKQKQCVLDIRTAAQIKPPYVRNSDRQRPGSHRRVNVVVRQHDLIWVPKGAAVPDSAAVGKFP